MNYLMALFWANHWDDIWVDEISNCYLLFFSTEFRKFFTFKIVLTFDFFDRRRVDVLAIIDSKNIVSDVFSVFWVCRISISMASCRSISVIAAKVDSHPFPRSSISQFRFFDFNIFLNWPSKSLRWGRKISWVGAFSYPRASNYSLQLDWSFSLLMSQIYY